MTPLAIVATPTQKRLVTRWWSGVTSFFGRTAGSAASWIDAHGTLAFGFLSILYLVAVFVLSYLKLLWLDELITLHIARLGSVSAIWRALAAGADPNPPLIHILVMFCRRIFGEWEFGLRLPAVVGYWVGMASLFAFLRRRVPAVWALSAAALSMAMGSFEWAYESRSYGVFYGTTMLALYCWSLAADPRSSRSRMRGLVGMTLAIAIGLCSNYFAILAVCPIAGAELMRMVVTKRSRVRSKSILDWPVWLGLALGVSPLLAFRRLIEASISKFEPHAWNRVSFQTVEDTYSFIVEATLFPLLALMIFGLAVWWLGRFCGKSLDEMRPRWLGRLAAAQAHHNRALPRPTLPELTAAFLLMIYPFLGYWMALIHGGMLSPRFVLPICFGFAIAGMLAVYYTFGHMRGAGAVMLLCCVLFFSVRESDIGYWYELQHESFYSMLAHIPPPEYPGQPIVIGDNLGILPFLQYAPKEMTDRTVFPVDFPVIQSTRGEDSSEQNMWAGRDWIYHFPLVPLADFQHKADSYLILTGTRDWILGDLLRHGYPATRLPIDAQSGALSYWATPLWHGWAVYFHGGGDVFMNGPKNTQPHPAPFIRDHQLPNGTASVDDGGPF